MTVWLVSAKGVFHFMPGVSLIRRATNAPEPEAQMVALSDGGGSTPDGGGNTPRRMGAEVFERKGLILKVSPSQEAGQAAPMGPATPPKR